MTKHNASRNQSRHDDINYHLGRDILKESKEVLKYFLTMDVKTDVCTKLLTIELFQKFPIVLGLRCQL